MSPPAFSKTAAVLSDALVHAAWAQWSGIERWSAGSPSRSIVDPEALVLGSLWLDQQEPRLWRVLQIWARQGARWLSVQRIKNLAADYPDGVQARLGAFAWECLNAGKDARWKALARKQTVAVRERGRELEPSPQFKSSAALLLRLRIALGVGIKADVLAYLIGTVGSRQTIGQVTIATGYHRRAVQRAVDELVVAGLLTPLATAPASYRAPMDAWGPLLGLGDDPPPWRHWHQLFALGAAMDLGAAETAAQSPYLQSTRARDVIARHRRAFDLNHVPISDPQTAPGEAYLAVLADDVRELATRVRKNFV
jgi:hypothetical protein